MNKDIPLAEDLELKRTKAMVEADIDSLSDLFSSTLSYGHSSGAIDDKAAMLEKISSGIYDYSRIDTKILSVTRSAGQLLIIMGNVQIDVILSGKHRIMDSVYVVVYQREEFSWKFLAHQTGLIKDLI